MERVGAFSFCQGQSKQNSTSFFLQLKESINRRLKFWPEKEPSAAESWPMVLALRIMRITEAPLKSALRLCHLTSCYHAGMQEQSESEKGKSPMLTVRLQSRPPHWLGILGYCNAAQCFFPCPEPLQQMRAVRLLWELYWAPRAREQERCAGGSGREGPPSCNNHPQKDLLYVIHPQLDPDAPPFLPTHISCMQQKADI